jgi:serine protease Do/serine protease DegQ
MNKGFVRKAAAVSPVILAVLAGGSWVWAADAGSMAPAKEADKAGVIYDDTPLDRTNRVWVTSYSDVVDKVVPAVVSVYTTVYVPGQGTRDYGVGSGSILTPDGYILTNHHVIAGSGRLRVDGIHVTLPDGRGFEAKLVGSDETTDIALIKINAKNLPTIKLADSDKLKVGDVVFAVGNPMDVGFTVTQGIISATGRSDLGLLDSQDNGNSFEDFIQTDASINPGNSGGPLVDAQGRQVGMDSAILSTSRVGGNIGLGFAIPSSLLHKVISDLMAYGTVRRGYLGVQLQDLDQDLAQGLGLTSSHGALVREVNPGTPASAAGVKVGDVVVKLNDHDVDTASKLHFLVATNEPGADADLTLYREGRAQVVKVRLGDRDATTVATLATPRTRAVPTPSQAPTANSPASQGPLAGVTLEAVTPYLRRQYNLPQNLSGLVVTSVDQNSPYAEQFAPGMVVSEVNRQAVTQQQEAKALMKTGAVNIFYVYSEGRFGYMPVVVPAVK